MARPLRIAIPDGVYHVTNRGLERRAVVRDDDDRVRWHDLLDRVAKRRRWRVFAWALMDNHFHLFLQTPDADLSEGMHDLESGYVSGFNRRHRRRGPLLQGRFKAILVERAAHDWELSRYVHLNPVRARIVERPEEYGWSSCRFYFRSRGAPGWLAWEEVLSQHGRTLRSARRAYREYLAEGIASPPESPLTGVVASTLLGSAGFVVRMREWLADRLPDRDVPAARLLRRRIGLERIEGIVCEAFGVPVERLGERGRWRNDARAVAIYLARELTGQPLAAIGARFGGVGSAAVSRTVSGVRGRARNDRALRQAIARCEDVLAESKK